MKFTVELWPGEQWHWKVENAANIYVAHTPYGSGGPRTSPIGTGSGGAARPQSAIDALLACLRAGLEDEARALREKESQG